MMAQEYFFNVSLYKSPPEGVENLQNLIQMAYERLKLYKIFQNNEFCSPSEIKLFMKDSPLKLLLEGDSAPGIQQARRTDDLSHWILRMAYSNYPKTFIKYEVMWFKMRFNCMKDVVKGRFLRQNGLELSPVPDGEKEKLGINMATCFQIRFTDILPLLSLRLYPLIKGFLYIPPEEMVYLALNDLERNLKKFLTYSTETSLSVYNDQLETILSSLELVTPSVADIMSPYTVSLQDLDEEATTNFPLCMRFQHETLRKTHHLKYFSRMQYGLFLKGIGLTLEESLQFWKEEFLHDMPEERFLRKYSYLFKHQYGTVGSRTDQRPYNCERILNETVSLCQTHGCPYKHWNEETLRERLKEYKIPMPVIFNIMELVNKKNCRQACTKYFEYYNSCHLEEPIIHPNQYYRKSCLCTKSPESDIEDIGDSFNTSLEY